MPPGTQTLFLRWLAAKRSRASAFWRSSQARVVPSQARFTSSVFELSQSGVPHRGRSVLANCAALIVSFERHRA
jgi:hypothetical protein